MNKKGIMKKLFITACALLSMILSVSCSSNPGVKAGKEFMKNPSIATFKAYTAEVANLDDEQKVELEEWTEDNKAELEEAVTQMLQSM